MLVAVDESGASSGAAAHDREGAEPAKPHVAIIMDGNGRWAARRGLPRAAGHRAGASAVRRVTRAAAELGVGTLTLFAFSSDNWRRPAAETNSLMRLLRVYLAREVAVCVRRGVRLSVVGRRDRLAAELRTLIAGAERVTRSGRELHLRLAIDYSARDEILRAADAWEAPASASADEVETRRRERFARLLGGAWCDADAGNVRNERAPDVDLLIRTGGERRLSDFLLWECAYAELSFLPMMFPDFTGNDLRAALDDFANRERRFGGLPTFAKTAVGGGTSDEYSAGAEARRTTTARWLD